MNNTDLTKILEDVDLDSVDPDKKQLASRTEREYVSRIIDAYKEKEINKNEAGKLLRQSVVNTKENKPLAILADFVDILNQSAKTNVISTSAIRKLAQKLGIKQGALDMLEEDDKVLVIKLVQHDMKVQTTKDAVPSKSPSKP